MNRLLFILIPAVLCTAQVFSQSKTSTRSRVESVVDSEYPGLDTLYKHLHRYPELSLQEEKTSKTLFTILKSLGYSVTDHIGGYGIAAVLKNGDGPTVLLRTDMDALPVEETTGLPYASKVKSKNAVGADVSVMHACGHDVHMTVFIGTARALVETKKLWKGTIVLIAQPSEENGFGAEAMFKDKLYERIPYPDYALALHNHADLPAGSIGYTDGAFMASVEMMNITVRGKGGHGAAPHNTIDPIVLAAQLTLALQTIVSREIDPLEPAVVTIGSVHGGTVHNVIPDEVKLQLTLRSYSPKVRAQIIASIENKARALAIQAGLSEDRFPIITINEPRTPATINDKALTHKLVDLLTPAFGKDYVVQMQPSMVGEDFSRFALQKKYVPITMFWLGTVDPQVYQEAKAGKRTLPILHTSSFAPSPEPTIKTGIKALTLSTIELLKP